ncbi:translation initiation factor IF-2 [Candidatus Dependentiae bacterium]|nr:translation initiation factor IF-2 [Candidatus Dependentiae bacterium]
MRVYEFSKKYNISNKELLQKLRGAGFEIKSHMSVLGEGAVSFLNKTFAKPSSTIESLINQQKEQEPQPKLEPKKIVERGGASRAVTTTLRASKSLSTVRDLRDKLPEKQKSIQPRELVLEDQAVNTLCQKASLPINSVMLTLLKWGVLASKNMMLPKEMVERIARYYEIPTVAPKQKKKEEERKNFVMQGAELRSRLPVAVVLGHVDHGKTTLLDFIRKTRVAAKEKGGITQHLGAYEAQTDHGSIVFLDTPGHEAFSKMRARGVRVADIAVLVVAADDSVMPQTIEAIKHAKSMGVPVVVAINKVDKVEPSRIETTRRDLAQHNLLPEEWGGDVVMIPISAKTGQGVDRLLEMILLQTELMELRADFSGLAKGYVLESKLERGRGPVATLLCVHGRIKVGDYFISGNAIGRVSSLINSAGQRIQSVGPSIPVQVSGFSTLPDAGDYFEVVSKEVYRSKSREIGGTLRRGAAAIGVRQLKTREMLRLGLIVKTDTNSSQEALLESIDKLSKKGKVGFTIVDASIGDVNESDVVLASNTGAKIVALHVKAEPNSVALAQKMGVTISSFQIIYKLLESLEEFAKGSVAPEVVIKKVGEAIVRRVFDIKKVGVIAGCYVSDGFFSHKGTVVGWRGRTKIGEGAIKSLQREKRTVKQVNAGFECGFIVDGITDWQVEDRVECFIEVPKEQV